LKEPVVSKGTYAERTFEAVDSAGSEVVAAEFRECRFVRCCFSESVLRACVFDECVFVECDLSLVKLPHSVFSSTRFEGSKIIGVNWTEARWPRLRLLVPLRFEKCVINHSTFLGLNLKGVRFTECTAKDVDFRETDLSEADFSGTDLTGAQFGSTNLTGANLRGARNYMIVPAGNTLKGARFSLPEAMSLLSGLDIEISGWD
jgi:uncharacterized protein YjbI with pentapeptide repeats